MSNYHISTNGTFELCGATKRACPLSGGHFSTRAVARINAGVPANSKERSAWLLGRMKEADAAVVKAKENIRRINKDLANNYNEALKASKDTIDELLNIQDKLEHFANPNSNNAATVAKANKALEELNPTIAAKVAAHQKLIDEVNEFLDAKKY